ncbi:hypothetical protein HDV01_000659 [Terramyces sp. JEL0728]|nr:hypothetical protein HDV01_000659 [Terramyces sp. JEL0728]
MDARSIGRSSNRKSASENSMMRVKIDKVKVDRIAQHTWYEKMNYLTDVLVPIDEEEELLVPGDCYLQQVHYGRNKKWRVVRNKNYNLPLYLKEHAEPEDKYDVFVKKNLWYGPLELGTPFLKRWDALALLLLFFTASVTPFETAFIDTNSNGAVNIDTLFLLNRFVDLIFFLDMFVQIRTPYRDARTGKLVLDSSVIATRYLASWFVLDLVSVLPFEYMNYIFPMKATNLSTLKILRFVRLFRLLKLLRVFRASRKLKQAQIASGLRYATLELLKIIFIIIFAIHWLACGFRLVGSATSPDDPLGWLDYYAVSSNVTVVPILDAYFISVYWSSGIVSLVGVSGSFLEPRCLREYIYVFCTNFIVYIIGIYIIAMLASIVNLTGKLSRKQDILVDEYLKMLDELRLDDRLKYTVFHHLSDHFTSLANHRQMHLLHQLPKQLHSFIAMEIYLDFIVQIPFLEIFCDTQPQFIQDVCQGIEKKMIPANNMLYLQGLEGIYYIEQGIVAVEGRVYPSGSMIGLSTLRENIKACECRALTDIKCNFLPRAYLLEVLDRYPKIKYYCKRWTQWEVLRLYIRTYTELYYTAARRGAIMNPPLLSKRPDMMEDEEDDIDVAVLDHIEEMGF